MKRSQRGKSTGNISPKQSKQALNEPHYTEMTGNAPLGSMRCSVCCKCDSRNKDSKVLPSDLYVWKIGWMLWIWRDNRQSVCLASVSVRCCGNHQKSESHQEYSNYISHGQLWQSPEHRIAPRIQQPLLWQSPEERIALRILQPSLWQSPKERIAPRIQQSYLARKWAAKRHA